MLLAVGDQVWLELIKTLATIATPIVLGLVGYWQWKLKQAEDKAKLDRELLAIAVERNSKVTDASHRLINSQHEGQLELMAMILEQKAKLSKDPDDIEFAKIARKRYEDQITVTKMINAEQLTGTLKPASTESTSSSLPGGPPAPIIKVDMIETGEIKVVNPNESTDTEHKGQ